MRIYPKDSNVDSHRAMSSDPSGTVMDFRPDIEGLRAIAIFMVVATHADSSWVPGGFVGVDVFFVLSGYLITSLLVLEATATGAIQVTAFYARRFRRLLPSFMSMLGLVSLLGGALLASVDQPEQATAAAAAAVWTSNLYFAYANVDYFSPSEQTNLFLHTWSLGVEEQFYLIWPALLVTALGIWRGKGRDPNARIILRLVRWERTMFLLCGLSLAFCIAQTQYAPEHAFYLMPARIWEFALGASVFACLRDSKRSAKPGSSSLLQLIGWAGFALITSSAILLDRDTPYPGAMAMFPAFGTACILAAGTRRSAFGIGVVLSLKPLRTIGRLSYSWYLWHWPILLFGGALLGSARQTYSLPLVLLSLGAAALSYRFIELPVRRSRFLQLRLMYTICGSVVLMVAAHLLCIGWHNAALDDMRQPQQQRIRQARTAASALNAMGCDDWYNSSKLHVCVFGPEKATHSVLLMGDSVAAQWFPALEKIFDRPDWRLIVLTKSACPMVDQTYFYAQIGRQYTECDVWRHAAVVRVNELKPDIVILGSALLYEFTNEQWKVGTSSLLEEINGASRQIYILRATPELPFNGPSCLAPRSWLGEFLSGRERCNSPASSMRGDQIFQSIEQAASSFANVRLIDMTDAVCPDNRCRAELDGVIVFRDERHITVAFARKLAAALAKHFHLIED